MQVSSMTPRTSTRTACLTSDLAARLDIPAWNIIDAAIAAGVEHLWLDGEKFGRWSVDQDRLLAVTKIHGTEGGVEFDLTDEQRVKMAEVLEVPAWQLAEVRS